MTADATESTLTIEQKWALLVRDFPKIAKTHKAPPKAGDYPYRSVWDIVNELRVLLAKYGLFYTPTVIDRERHERKFGSGGVGYEVSVHVVLTLRDEGGDEMDLGDAWGEAADAGDKATAKAMTNAVKQILTHALAIADPDLDTDAHSVPESIIVNANDERHHNLRTNIKAGVDAGLIPEEELAALKRQYGKFPLPIDTMDEAEKAVAEIIAKNTPEPKES